MTNKEALRRSIKALRKAYDDSDCFDHGDLASHDIKALVEEALVAEFSARARTEEIRT